MLCLTGFYAAAQDMDIRISIPAKEDTAHINTLLRKAATLMAQREGPDSIHCRPLLQAALKASREADYAYGICYALMGLSRVAAHYGNYSPALHLLEEAAKNNHGFAQKDIRKKVVNAKAVIYDQLGIYDSAIACYLLEVANIKEHDLSQQARIYCNIGQLFKKIGNYPKAHHYLTLAEETASSGKDSPVLAGILINKANLYYAEHKGKDSWKKSIEYTTKALAISREQKKPELIQASLSNLASYIMNAPSPDYKKALYYLNEAQSITTVSEYGRLYLWIDMGNCYYGLKAYTKGDSILRKAEKVAMRSGSRELITEIYSAFATGYKQRGDYKNALHYTELKGIMQDSLTGENVSTKISQLQHQYETAQKDNELIKKELLITRQQATIEKKNILGGGIIAFILISGTFLLLYYRNKIRIQKQAEKQNLETATWRATLEGEEKERRHLAHELHDNIGGMLSTVRMCFHTIGEREHGLMQHKEYHEALQLLDNTLMEVRHTAHHLMPELLLRFGLAEAVRIFCANTQKATGIKIDYRYLGYIGQLERSFSLIIYRSIQELVHNIIKHAHATHILVQLSCHNALLSITVEDNGTGLNPDAVKHSRGMGLTNIRNSVEKLGGSFDLYSEQGNGTTIDIDIHLNTDTLTPKSSNTV